MDASSWIENQVEKMLRDLRASGYFNQGIEDAREFHRQGYVWDVALRMSCNYWCSYWMKG